MKQLQIIQRIQELRFNTPGKNLLLALLLISNFGLTANVQAQCSLNCFTNPEIALPNRQNYVVTEDDLVSTPGTSCPGGNFRVKLFDNNGNYLGRKVNYLDIGNTYTAEITDLNSGASCSTNLSVLDNEAPSISTQNLFLVCSSPVDPTVIGYPEISDNISLLDTSDLNFSDAYQAFACFTQVGDSVVTGQITRTWYAVDESGNVGTAVQKLYYVRKTVDDIDFPKNRDGFEAPYLQCHRDNPNDIAFTGSPTINNYSVYTYNTCEFAVTYTDQVSNVCGGETRIIRRWSAIDWCTDSVRNVVQVIRVRDVLAPDMVVPDTLVVPTDPNKCTATVTLPNAVVTDSCSATTLRKTWTYGFGDGPFRNVSTGTHEVTYTATDACGNETIGKTAIVVKDQQQPSAVCDNNKEINLNSDGVVTVFALSFNDASFDNCGILEFQVSRDGGSFAEKTTFTCTDLDQTIPITMKVIDVNGLESTCSATVVIKDRTQPQITCPTSLSIDCVQDYKDVTLTGNGTATDNCTLNGVTFSDLPNLNNCGLGTVSRTWRATDAHGNSSTCLQTITIEDNTPIVVDFPDDYVIYECGASTEPVETGNPLVNGDDCESLDISYFDQEFPTAMPACYKVLRRWTVVDWCAYNQQSGNNVGIWSADQTIQVLDNTPPVLNLPGDVVIGALNGSCEGALQIADITADDCSDQVTITNDSPYASKKNASPNGLYPVGVHYVTFSAFDGCGNTTTGQVKITVVDDKPPTPICNMGVSLSLNSDGEINILPSIVVQTGFDNCTASANLEYSVSPSTFYCDKLGDQIVTVSATDEAGNVGTCNTTVLIQDNLDVCSAIGDKASIGGNIYTYGNSPANQVLVGLSGGLIAGRQSDIDGSYLFENLPKGENYTVRPTYDDNRSKGISTIDLVYIQKHILNVEPFKDPYQHIAADANKNGAVSTVDVVILRKIILRVSNELPNNTSWRFVDAKYIFPDDKDPNKVAFPEAITLPDLSFNRLGNDFIAIKIGDVTGDARLNTFDDDVDNRSEYPSLTFTANNEQLKAGQEKEISLYSSHDMTLSGFQFTLDMEQDDLEMLDFGSTVLKNFDDRNLGQSPNLRGALTVSWSNDEAVNLLKGQQVFTLKLRARKDLQLADAMAINSRFTEAEAYSWTSENELEIWRPELTFGSTKNTTLSVTVAPNPMSDQASFRWNNPMSGLVNLKVYNLSGQLIESVERNCSEGAHVWKINTSHWPEGILMYELRMSDGSMANGKMIKRN